MISVKICGLMNREDVDLCVQAGVHAAGFVVEYPVAVPWNLTRSEARMLINAVPAHVNSSIVVGGSVSHIMAVARYTRPNIMQLHYQETLEEVNELSRRLTRLGIKTVKALRISRDGRCDFEIPDPVAAARALEKTELSALLVDSFTTAMPGGTGVAVDISVFQAIRQEVEMPVILAGGLHPGNIRQICMDATPYGVDVLTGVEARSGKKDPLKVHQLMQTIFSL